MQLELFKNAYAPTWMNAPTVKCKGNVSFFYPNKPSTAVSQAKLVCNGSTTAEPCPHRAACLKHAIDYHEAFGVWGGTSERERRKIQQARKRYRNPYIYDLVGTQFPGLVRVARRDVVWVGRLRLVN